MRPSKILIITNRVPYPLKDGGALAMHALLTGYMNAGWTVGLITMNTSRHPVPDDKIPEILPNLAYLQSVPVENEISLRKITSNFIFSKEPEHAKRFYNVNFEAEIIDALKEFKPDVVQFESIFLSTYLPAVKKVPEIITVLRMHNIEHQIWYRLSEESKNPLKKAYLNNLAGRIERYEEEWWPQYDVLLPITESDALSIKEKLPKQTIITAPFGIHTEMITVKKKEYWHGYHIGAMDWLPNQEAVRWFVKEVWPELRTQVPDFSFYYAGRNMPDEFYHYATMGVHCEGEVENAQEFIADKKILIVPLKSGGGIRVKTMEAMAAGKLVISTAMGMKGIELEDRVHYLQANNKQEFIDAIKWALEHKEEAEKIAKAGQQIMREQFDLQDIMQRVSTPLLELIKR